LKDRKTVVSGWWSVASLWWSVSPESSAQTIH
jgi:hypothetical protein